MKTAIIVDSTASINEKYESHPDLYEVKTYTIKPDGTLVTCNRHDAKEFYDWMAQTDVYPTTAQTETGSYVDLFEKLIADGYERIICCLISSVTSGLFTTACTVAREYEDQAEFIMFDTKKWGGLIEAFAVETLKMSEAGYSSEELVKRLEWLRSEADYSWLLPDVSVMVAGGRLPDPGPSHNPNMKGLMSSDKDGYHYLKASVRSKKKAYKVWISELDEAYEKYPAGINIYLAHTADLEGFQPFIDVVEERYPDANVEVRILSLVMGAHAGTGTQCMAWCPNYENYDLMN